MNTSTRNLIMGLGAILIIGGLIFFRSNTPSKNSEDVIAPPVDTPTTTEVPAVAVGKSTTIATNSTNKVTTSPNKSAPVLQTGKPYKEFVRPTGFTNTRSLNLLDRDTFTLKDFIGKKVVLLNFWTTSSSNALRMLPYLNQWDAKYTSKGLLVVSIHVPRFAFEKSKDVVDKMAFAYHVTSPIVLDNNAETWKAYGNTVWPHQYLIDINGMIVYDHAGEGAYDATEAKIVQLLSARTTKLGLVKDIYAPVSVPSDAIAVDLSKLKSPETYFGSARNASLGNVVTKKDGTQDLVFIPTAVAKLNAPLLNGSWTFTSEYAMPMVANAGVRYQYTAKSIQAVLDAQKLTRVKVTRDGAPLTPEVAGSDIRFEKGESFFYVSGARIYDIVEGESYGTHTLDFSIESSGLMLYTITFG